MNCVMAVTVEMHHTGDAASQREVAALIEHMLADRPGDWRVSIVGSQGNDRWEMKITGPNAFERSYTLEGSAGEHEPQAIAKNVARMVPGEAPNVYRLLDRQQPHIRPNRPRKILDTGRVHLGTTKLGAVLDSRQFHLGSAGIRQILDRGWSYLRTSCRLALDAEI